jgi:hypothetical protein
MEHDAGGVMTVSPRTARILIIAGLVTLVIGLIDPLEGSLVILPGTALAALGAALGRASHRTLLYWGFALVAVGVGAMWGMSALGGIGGSTGRSMWWALLLLPYPVGWVLGLVGAVRSLRTTPGAAAAP